MQKSYVIIAKNTKFTGTSKAGNPIEMYKGMDAQLAKILSKRDARGAKGRWVTGEKKAGEDRDGETIYVPTEAGLPILEAGKR